MKDYYKNNLSPLVTTFIAVGALEKSEAVNSIKAISANWAPKNIDFPEIPQFEMPKESIFELDEKEDFHIIKKLI